jgi:hypothetical protein
MGERKLPIQAKGFARCPLAARSIRPRKQLRRAFGFGCLPSRRDDARRRVGLASDRRPSGHLCWRGERALRGEERWGNDFATTRDAVGA